ncbi:MAG: tetratricopeptide repeat protein [Ectothiorhodospiraceae bacterium]|nr:tetratricopeptide repeat protein [Ectothiorhodospiraceae bacterium]
MIKNITKNNKNHRKGFIGRRIGWVILITAITLVGCAGKAIETDPNQSDIGNTQDASRAVKTLLAKADTQASHAHFERAAALIERALRIEPRNAHLWHRLASVRLQQGKYAQAESLAQKSSSLAKGNEELQQRNLELIDAARMLAEDDKRAG